MTPDERARAVCEEMASGPLILEVPFDEWVRRQVAGAIRAAVEEEREDCARVAEGFVAFTGHRGDDPGAYGRTDDYGRGNYNARASIAAAIRTRGGETA
jgi:hypothetical protein